MATVRMSIFGAAMLPDTSGNSWFEPASITQTNDLFPQQALRLKDSGTKTGAGFRFSVPNDYAGSPVFEVICTSTATTGDFVLDVDYSSGAKTASLDPAAAEESVTVTQAAPASSQTGVAPTMSATAGNFAAGNICQGLIARDGASGSDTMAADLIVYDVIFQYAT